MYKARPSLWRLKQAVDADAPLWRTKPRPLWGLLGHLLSLCLGSPAGPLQGSQTSYKTGAPKVCESQAGAVSFV